MTTLEKFQEVANIKIVDNFFNSADIQISEWCTADGYTVYVMCEDPRRLNWEDEVWYYKPEFDDIMNYIGNVQYNDTPVEISVDDIDEYFDEYYMLDYLQDNMDEDEFEKFTDENE